MIMSSVVSIGHISTVALAAATIGFMTANVTGLSIIHGLVSTLDTMLPGAWTSDQPHLVGLWTQRMSEHDGLFDDRYSPFVVKSGCRGCYTHSKSSNPVDRVLY